MFPKHRIDNRVEYIPRHDDCWTAEMIVELTTQEMKYAKAMMELSNETDFTNADAESMRAFQEQKDRLHEEILASHPLTHYFHGLGRFDLQAQDLTEWMHSNIEPTVFVIERVPIDIRHDIMDLENQPRRQARLAFAECVKKIKGLPEAPKKAGKSWNTRELTQIADILGDAAFMDIAAACIIAQRGLTQREKKA